MLQKFGDTVRCPFSMSLSVGFEVNVCPHNLNSNLEDDPGGQ